MELDKDTKVIYGIWIFVVASSILFIPLISSALTDDIVSYWKFDEQDTTGSGTIYDELGANNGTNNGASNTTGKINTAYSFDGDNDYIGVPDSADFDIANGTISLWIYPKDLTSDDQYWMAKDAAGSNDDFGIASTDYDGGTRGNVNFWLQPSDASGTEHITSDDPLQLSTWTHVVITFGSGGMQMYVNGTLQADTVVDTHPISGGTANLTIGALTSAFGYCNTSIDEPGIWEVEFDQDKVDEIYNSYAGNQYPFVVDTCTCAGAGNDWEIDMSDYCNITSACDLTTGTLSFTGAGWCNCNASVDTTNLGDPGASGILYIQDSCLITVD